MGHQSLLCSKVPFFSVLEVSHYSRGSGNELITCWECACTPTAAPLAIVWTKKNKGERYALNLFSYVTGEHRPVSVSLLWYLFWRRKFEFWKLNKINNFWWMCSFCHVFGIACSAQNCKVSVIIYSFHLPAEVSQWLMKRKQPGIVLTFQCDKGPPKLTLDPGLYLAPSWWNYRGDRLDQHYMIRPVMQEATTKAIWINWMLRWALARHDFVAHLWSSCRIQTKLRSSSEWFDFY